MKATNEKQEISRLKRVWSTKVDFDAKEFLHIEVALMRVKKMLDLNPTWLRLKHKALLIAEKIDDLKAV